MENDYCLLNHHRSGNGVAFNTYIYVQIKGHVYFLFTGCLYWTVMFLLLIFD